MNIVAPRVVALKPWGDAYNIFQLPLFLQYYRKIMTSFSFGGNVPQIMFGMEGILEIIYLHHEVQFVSSVSTDNVREYLNSGLMIRWVSEYFLHR